MAQGPGGRRARVRGHEHHLLITAGDGKHVTVDAQRPAYLRKSARPFCGPAAAYRPPVPAEPAPCPAMARSVASSNAEGAVCTARRGISSSATIEITAQPTR